MAIIQSALLIKPCIAIVIVSGGGREGGWWLG